MAHLYVQTTPKYDTFVAYKGNVYITLYVLQSLKLPASKHQSPKNKGCRLFFFKNPKFKQFSTFVQKLQFQNLSCNSSCNCCNFCCNQLQLIAIPIKYSCDKNMCVKDWSEISWMKKLLKKVIIVLARNLK